MIMCLEQGFAIHAPKVPFILRVVFYVQQAPFAVAVRRVLYHAPPEPSVVPVPVDAPLCVPMRYTMHRMEFNVFRSTMDQRA